MHFTVSEKSIPKTLERETLGWGERNVVVPKGRISSGFIAAA